jgi:hypothetical protein
MTNFVAPPRRRLVVAVAAAVLTLLVVLPVGGSGAAELSAKNATNKLDPAGDVPYCQGDIGNITASWNDEGLLLGVYTQCVMSATDPHWTVGETAVAWLLDEDDDEDPEYVAVFDAETPGVLLDADGRVVCNANQWSRSMNWFTVRFASDCVPPLFTFAAAMVFDENPHGDTCTCPEDFAPDGAFAGPVYKGNIPPPVRGQGYWMLAADGEVYAFGDADPYPAWPTPIPPGAAIDVEPTPSGRGYWVVNEGGGVRYHGDAAQKGQAGSLRPGEVATAISRTRTGAGYWLFTNQGRVLPFGDAEFFGDMSAIKLNGPVLDAIPTPSGRGYYMVASDGGIFTFGDAVFQGSMGSTRLNAPVQSLVPDPDGVGYWLVASDGGIFSFEADFHGSMGSTRLNRPVTGMVGFGRGYLMVAEDGGIFTFGDAPFFGSLGDDPPDVPIVSTAILNQ